MIIKHGRAITEQDCLHTQLRGLARDPPAYCQHWHYWELEGAGLTNTGTKSLNIEAQINNYHSYSDFSHFPAVVFTNGNMA